MYDPRQDRSKNIFRRAYEAVVGAIAQLLENRPRDEVATKTELSGRIDNPNVGTVEAIVRLRAERVRPGHRARLRAGEPAEVVRLTPGTYPMAHILLVEDDADSREALRFLLEHSGHRVSVAGDGREAIALRPPRWSRTGPSSTLGCPDIDGYEAARGVRAGAPAVHMVALTGYGRPEDRQRAFDAGFDAHMMKPVDPDRLVEIITPR